MTDAWILASLALLALAAETVRRIRGINAEVLARWRADQRHQQTIADVAECEAIWAISQPHIPQPREENGQ